MKYRGLIDKAGEGWVLTIFDEDGKAIIVFFFDYLEAGEYFLQALETIEKEVEEVEKTSD